METLIGLRSQGGVPVTQSSGLKKKCLGIPFLPLEFAVSYFDLFKRGKIFFDLFKIGKTSIFNYDLLKVSKMTILVVTSSKSAK